MNSCKAYRENDMMVCGQCGLQWSIGDSDRPDCKPGATKSLNQRDQVVKIRQTHNLKQGVK